MKWKKQAGGGNYYKWTEVDQELEGTWLGQHDGKFGPNGSIDVHGKEIIFPIHTALVQLLEDIKEGKIIKIVYLGKQLNKNTGREYKGFDVYVQEDEDDVKEPI